MEKTLIFLILFLTNYAAGSKTDPKEGTFSMTLHYYFLVGEIQRLCLSLQKTVGKKKNMKFFKNVISVRLMNRGNSRDALNLDTLSK